MNLRIPFVLGDLMKQFSCNLYYICMGLVVLGCQLNAPSESGLRSTSLKQSVYGVGTDSDNRLLDLVVRGTEEHVYQSDPSHFSDVDKLAGDISVVFQQFVSDVQIQLVAAKILEIRQKSDALNLEFPLQSLIDSTRSAGMKRSTIQCLSTDDPAPFPGRFIVIEIIDTQIKFCPGFDDLPSGDQVAAIFHLMLSLVYSSQSTISNFTGLVFSEDFMLFSNIFEREFSELLSKLSLPNDPVQSTTRFTIIDPDEFGRTMLRVKDGYGLDGLLVTIINPFREGGFPRKVAFAPNYRGGNLSSVSAPFLCRGLQYHGHAIWNFPNKETARALVQIGLAALPGYDTWVWFGQGFYNGRTESLMNLRTGEIKAAPFDEAHPHLCILCEKGHLMSRSGGCT
jgi:hypothetical protein